MTERILVAYASRLGSTAGLAEAIGRTLAEAGADVNVRPMIDVRDASAYRAVVAGSAIRDRRWLPEAMDFVRAHRGALSRRPFAAFLVCVTLAMPRAAQYRPGVAAWLDPVRALVRPVSEGLFPGVLDIQKVPSLRHRPMFRMSVAMGVW